MWRTRLALRNLSTAKLRSTLTILGVVIGVAFIAATLVVGTSAVVWFNSQAFGKGSNIILLSTGAISSGGNYNVNPTPIFGNDTVSAVISVSGVALFSQAGIIGDFGVIENGKESIVAQPLEFVDPALLNALGVISLSGLPQGGGLILSNSTAHLLNARVGSNLTLVTQSRSAPATWTVTGIFAPPTSGFGGILALGAYLPLDTWKGPYSEIYVLTNGVTGLAEA